MIPELYLPYFEHKKVTVMGLGLLGRGVGDTAFLAKNGASVLVTDKKTQEQLQVSLDALKEYSNIQYVVGEHRVEDFEDRDFVMKAAGVPCDSEYIAHAEAHGIPVYMSAALVCDIIMKNLPDVVIIGVTGTRGKSTTTELIAHILRENGSRVHLGGNIRGVANLPLLDEVEDGDFLVLELDSWQLQGFGDMGISPHIAVFTSFMDDHMNYYKNDRDLYFKDKANIYRNQREGDVLIASPQAGSEIIMRGERVAISVPENNTFEMRLIGEHNQVIARLAYDVASQCGLTTQPHLMLLCAHLKQSLQPIINGLSLLLAVQTKGFHVKR
jgi:UDP-N-acetylmuramoylalanine-D-glutamate ligase